MKVGAGWSKQGRSQACLNPGKGVAGKVMAKLNPRFQAQEESRGGWALLGFGNTAIVDMVRMSFVGCAGWCQGATESTVQSLLESFGSWKYWQPLKSWKCLSNCLCLLVCVSALATSCLTSLPTVSLFLQATHSVLSQVSLLCRATPPLPGLEQSGGGSPDSGGQLLRGQSRVCLRRRGRTPRSDAEPGGGAGSREAAGD